MYVNVYYIYIYLYIYNISIIFLESRRRHVLEEFRCGAGHFTEFWIWDRMAMLVLKPDGLVNCQNGWWTNDCQALKRGYVDKLSLLRSLQYDLQQVPVRLTVEFYLADRPRVFLSHDFSWHKSVPGCQSGRSAFLFELKIRTFGRWQREADWSSFWGVKEFLQPKLQQHLKSYHLKRAALPRSFLVDPSGCPGVFSNQWGNCWAAPKWRVWQPGHRVNSSCVFSTCVLLVEHFMLQLTRIVTAALVFRMSIFVVCTRSYSHQSFHQ